MSIDDQGTLAIISSYSITMQYRPTQEELGFRRSLFSWLLVGF